MDLIKETASEGLPLCFFVGWSLVLGLLGFVEGVGLIAVYRLIGLTGSIGV